VDFDGLTLVKFKPRQDGEEGPSTPPTTPLLPARAGMSRRLFRCVSQRSPVHRLRRHCLRDLVGRSDRRLSTALANTPSLAWLDAVSGWFQWVTGCEMPGT
jgi:hypothetical protein